MMPKRKPSIPAAQRAPSRATFHVSSDVPRRGWAESIVWPDTGVLLALGTDATLLKRFRQLYGGRVRIARGVAHEIRRISETTLMDQATDADHERVNSAKKVVQAFLLAGGAFPVVQLEQQDLTAVADVTPKLHVLGQDPS